MGGRPDSLSSRHATNIWRAAVPAALAFLLVVVGCGAPPPVDVPAATSANLPSPAATDVVPAEIEGAWVSASRIVVVFGGPAVTITLKFGEGTYRVDWRGGAVTGRIAVRGDEIEFKRSTRCPGIGVYNWSLDGDSLQFTEINEECPGRRLILDGVTYTREE